MDPTRAAAHLVGSQGEAMKAAAANTGTGPAMAFMGMGMAGQMGGMNAQNLFQMGQQQQAQQADPGAQVTDALTTPHFGKVSQQECVGGGLEHVVVKAEAKTARPQLIPVLHAASSSAHSCTIR